MRHILTLLALAGLSGCVVPVFADCFVPELVSGDSIATVVARNEDRECYRVFGSLPGQYTLTRPSYKLEISTGDRWFPMLWLRATDASGERLELQGDGILPMTEPFHTALAQSPGEVERYDAIALVGPYGEFAAPSASPFSLTVRVVSPVAGVLGEEVLRFNMIVASHYSVDGP